MITIVENTFKHILKFSRRSLFTINNISNYSTKKGEEGKDNDHNTKNEENQNDKNIETQQEQKHKDKIRLLDKFNLLNKKVQENKTQIESHKDYEEIKAQYKKLNSDLSSGRDKITAMIAQGEKNWQNTKQKISKIEDRQISQFGTELINFNDHLKELAAVHEKKQEDTLGEGIAMTSRILLNSLQKFNFRPYEPVKEKYDSKKHINSQEGQIKKDAIVVQVINPGWIYKDTIIKPAVVKTN